MNAIQPPSVLYAEDNPDDAYFMQRAFEQAGVPNPLIILKDGGQTIQYLEKEASDKRVDSLSPCLLLLDLKLPVKSGFDVLQWLREHPKFITLPVVVVSASGQQLDIDLATKMGINDYIIKPSNPTALIKIVRERLELWVGSQGRQYGR
jgi:CheY-like chemotaxis protein